MKAKLYDIITYFWHRILGQPIFLKKAYDHKVKNPKLTIIFLHGIAADSGTWNTTLKSFANNKELSDVRIVALDLLGFGKTIKPRWLKYNYEEYNKVLRRTIKKLHTKSPVILIGHSMGSLIAAEYAYEYPDKIAELILVSPPVLLNQEIANLPDKFYLKSYGSLYKYSNDPGIKLLASFVDKVSSFRAEYLNTVAFERSMNNIILNPKNYQFFKHLKVKTHIIHGRLDGLVLKPNLAKLAKENSKYIKLSQVISQHDISANKRGKILSSIKEFLAHETV